MEPDPPNVDTFWDLEKLKRPDYSEVSDFEFSYHGQSGLFLSSK